MFSGAWSLSQTSPMNSDIFGLSFLASWIPFFPRHIVLHQFHCMCGSLCGSRTCVDQFAAWETFPFSWSALVGAQRKGRKCGYTSIKTLVCPLWRYAAMHFGYKETALLSPRTEEEEDSELFLGSLHLVTTSQPHRAQGLQIVEVFESLGVF